MKNKKIKAKKGLFRGKMRYVFFLMACMVPLLAVQGDQNYESDDSIIPCFDYINTPISDETVTYEAGDSLYAFNVIESSANVTLTTGNRIRLMDGFRANKGSFFRAYINNNPMQCNGGAVPKKCLGLSTKKSGCCVGSVDCDSKVSKFKCCIDKEENSIAGYQNGDFKKGWTCKLNENQAPVCFNPCPVKNDDKGCCRIVGETCIPQADTRSKCCKWMELNPHIDIRFSPDMKCNQFTGKCVVPPNNSCTGTSPTSTVCCLTDNGCQEMTEQACCEAGYDPADSEACVVNGSVECSVITCGHCYRCEVIDGVNKIEAIAPYNQAECGADPNYTWSPNVVCVGDPCPGNLGTCYRCVFGSVTGAFASTQGECDGVAGYTWTTDVVQVGDSCFEDCDSKDDTVTGCCDNAPGSGCIASDPNSPVTARTCCQVGGIFHPGVSCIPPYHYCEGSGPDTGNGSGSAKLSTDDIAVEIIPNPNNGTFTFKLDSPLEGVLDMKIFDMTGRVVYEEASSFVFSGEYQKEIQLPASLAAGVYNIKVIVGEGQINKRIVIQR